MVRLSSSLLIVIVIVIWCSAGEHGRPRVGIPRGWPEVLSPVGPFLGPEQFEVVTFGLEPLNWVYNLPQLGHEILPEESVTQVTMCLLNIVWCALFSILRRCWSSWGILKRFPYWDRVGFGKGLIWLEPQSKILTRWQKIRWLCDLSFFGWSKISSRSWARHNTTSRS